MKNYFITVFNRYDNYGIHSTRCWGYYPNWEDANEVVHNNMTDLWEYTYDYAVIEEIKPGISSYAYPRWFYKYNQETNKYNMIEEPEELKHFCNFGVG